jgi:fatty-acyl-CoA synthase
VLPTSPAFPAAFFGVALAAAVPVPLYPPVRLGALGEYNAATARLLTAVEAVLVLTEPRIAAVLGEALERARPRLGARAVGALPAPAGPRSLPAVGPGDLAFIQFSSGSTQDPKPVALTHAAVLAQCAMLEVMLPPAPAGQERRGVSWLPLYHDMGLVAGPLLAAHVRGTLALVPPELFLARPSLWLRALSRHRATLTPAPPFALGLCARRIGEAEMTGVDLSALQLLTVGGEPIVPATVSAFAARFASAGLDPRAIRPVYGLSEAALAVTFCPPGRLLRVANVDPELLARGTVAAGPRPVVSVGVPLPGVEVELRDGDGAPVGEDRLGRIHVRGPSLMSGYFGRPRETAEALSGGWLDTGDLGFVADGELHVSGRVKDVVIVRGANHDAQEFEAGLAGVPGVRPGCAVAAGFLPPGAEAEELLVLAERDPLAPAVDDHALEGSVREAVLRGTGVAPHTVALLAPGSLPRTASGKLRRAEALRRFQAGTLRPPPGADAVRLAGALARSAAAHLRARAGRG